MNHNLYLITKNGHPFKDHWAFLVTTKDNTRQGQYYNAAGSVKEGFAYEKEGFCDLDDITQSHKQIFLSEISSQPDFERVCESVAPPGPTLRSASSDAPRSRIQQRDCQWWIMQVLAELENQGIIPAETSKTVTPQ